MHCGHPSQLWHVAYFCLNTLGKRDQMELLLSGQLIAIHRHLTSCLPCYVVIIGSKSTIYYTSIHPTCHPTLPWFWYPVHGIHQLYGTRLSDTCMHNASRAYLSAYHRALPILQRRSETTYKQSGRPSSQRRKQVVMSSWLSGPTVAKSATASSKDLPRLKTTTMAVS